MPKPITLRGITWDHDRGLRPLVATAAAYADREPNVRIDWQVRSLQAFADEDVPSLSERFDLVVLDHPSIGAAVERGSLVALDEHLDPAFLADQEANSVGRSFDSYAWDGHVWALAIDAAAQVASYRPDLLDRLGADVPTTWDDVVALAGAAGSIGAHVAMPSIPVDAVLAYLARVVADGTDPFAAAPDERAEALDGLRELVAIAHPASTTWNPPATYERMASADDVVYCPLGFGYSNYSRADYRPHLLASAPAPAGRRTRTGTLGGAGIAVSARTPNRGEAVRHAAFVASGDVQRTTYVEAAGQPGHRSAWLDDRANEMTHGYFRDTLPGLDAAYLRPRHAGFVEFQDRAGELVHRYLAEGGDPLDVVGRLDAIDAETRGNSRS